MCFELTAPFADMELAAAGKIEHNGPTERQTVQRFDSHPDANLIQLVAVNVRRAAIRFNAANCARFAFFRGRFKPLKNFNHAKQLLPESIIG